MTLRHATFYVLPPLLQVFLEAESVVAAEPAAVSVAEPSPEVPVLAAEPEVSEPEAVSVAEPQAFALVSVAAELSLEAPVLAAEPSPELPVLVSEPRAVSAAAVSVADVAEPQASVYIAFAFVVLAPVSAVVVEVYSSGRPKFLAFPNVDHSASPSSSVEVFGREFVHSSTGARTNYGLCSILSNPGLHQNKNLGHCYNNPSPDYNNVSDTIGLPMDATTSHSRKTCLRLY